MPVGIAQHLIRCFANLYSNPQHFHSYVQEEMGPVETPQETAERRQQTTVAVLGTGRQGKALARVGPTILLFQSLPSGICGLMFSCLLARREHCLPQSAIGMRA